MARDAFRVIKNSFYYNLKQYCILCAMIIYVFIDKFVYNTCTSYYMNGIYLLKDASHRVHTRTMDI